MKIRRPRAPSVLTAENVLGVDLGSHTLKVLRLRIRPSGAVAVVDYVEQEVASRLAEAKSEEERLEVYGHALQAIARERGLTGSPCALSLSGGTVLLRFLRLPRKHRVDLETGIPDDAKAHLPFEAREARFAVRELGGADPSSPSVDLLLAAAESRLVSAAVTAARRAGLLPTVLYNDALAVEAAHRFFRRADAEPVLLVDVGASTTSAVLMHDGAARAARVFNIAGNAFTRAVRRELGVEPAQAEALKVRFGLSGPAGDAEAGRVAKALRGPARDLLVELHRTLDAQGDRPGGVHARRVLLSGGGARLKGLSDLLGADLGLPVEMFRPLEEAVTPRGSGIEHASPSLAVAAGLAATGALRARGVKPMSLVPDVGAWSSAADKLSSRRFELALGACILAVTAALFAVTERWAARGAERGEQALASAPKPAPKPAPVVHKAPPKPVSPFAYLGRLTVSGVVGGESGRAYMLAGPDRSFMSRGGLLYDQDDALVPGVFVQAVDGRLVLTTSHRDRFEIPLPD
jgi:type IV pilus assembly protein PilM